VSLKTWTAFEWSHNTPCYRQTLCERRKECYCTEQHRT